MTRTRRAGAFVSALVSLLVAAVFTGAVPATAASYSPFSVAGYADMAANGYAYGGITWHNRTATVNGIVWLGESTGYVTVAFEAFAGDKKIDTETRTVNPTYSCTCREFGFVIGDPNLVGGINRVRVTIIGDTVGAPQHVWRP